MKVMRNYKGKNMPLDNLVKGYYKI